MFNDELFSSIMTLYDDFLFKKGVVDFFRKMQREGIEAARVYWYSRPYSANFPPGVPDIYEALIKFYSDYSLAPGSGYDELIELHERLQRENTFLRETMMQLRLKMFEESGEMARRTWKGFVDKQIGMNRDMAANFFEFFGHRSPPSEGRVTEEPSGESERRRETRHTYGSPVEFVVSGADEKTLKGVVLDISDSGLRINSSAPLSRGQKILMKSSLPIRHQTLTVRWVDALVAGLAA